MIVQSSLYVFKNQQFKYCCHSVLFTSYHSCTKKISNKETFINYCTILYVASTTPVSSARRERNFSSERRLKNWLCANVVQQRFTNLSVLSIDLR